MTRTLTPRVGSILWRDLTVADAARVRDFYEKVVGWESSPVDMGGYADFNMAPPDDAEPVAGICHARGANAHLPPQWLIYIVVEDLDESISACEEMGGRVISAPRSQGGARFCVIADPAGAVCALYQPSDAA